MFNADAIVGPLAFGYERPRFTYAPLPGRHAFRHGNNMANWGGCGWTYRIAAAERLANHPPLQPMQPLHQKYTWAFRQCN